jgi:hypothetical protein
MPLAFEGNLHTFVKFGFTLKKAVSRLSIFDQPEYYPAPVAAGADVFSG